MGRQLDRIAAVAFALAVIGYGIYSGVALYRAYGFLLDPRVVATTVAGLDRAEPGRTRVALAGRLHVENVPTLNARRQSKLFEEIETYLYPVRDGSAEAGIYVASRVEPERMAALYGAGPATVEGVWRQFTPAQRAQLAARDAPVPSDGFLEMISEDNPLDLEPLLNGGAVVLLCLVAGLGIGMTIWRKGIA